MRTAGEGCVRLCQTVCVFLLLVVTLPLWCVIAFLVKISSPGPVVYRQYRYGKNKKVFNIIKFRTMPVGAENGQPVWGREVDPRATAIGNFLRSTHIDELPQLINVLRGEMSLVGPRAERPYFADMFARAIPHYDERFSVRPGITGWAQVNGFRGNSSVEERTEYDRYYIRHRSLLLDFLILVRTPFARPVQRRSQEAKAPAAGVSCKTEPYALAFSPAGDEV